MLDTDVSCGMLARQDKDCVVLGLKTFWRAIGGFVRYPFWAGSLLFGYAIALMAYSAVEDETTLRILEPPSQDLVWLAAWILSAFVTVFLTIAIASTWQSIVVTGGRIDRLFPQWAYAWRLCLALAAASAIATVLNDAVLAILPLIFLPDPVATQHLTYLRFQLILGGQLWGFLFFLFLLLFGLFLPARAVGASGHLSDSLRFGLGKLHHIALIALLTAVALFLAEGQISRLGFFLAYRGIELGPLVFELLRCLPLAVAMLVIFGAAAELHRARVNHRLSAPAKPSG